MIKDVLNEISKLEEKKNNIDESSLIKSRLYSNEYEEKLESNELNNLGKENENQIIDDNLA